MEKTRSTNIAQETAKITPLRRDCRNSSNSICKTALLQDLDWNNWWQDNGYIHVKRSHDETWHRVFPKPIRGHRCTRMAVFKATPHWLYDMISQRPTDSSATQLPTPASKI